jgi:hypothetical protein
MSDAFTSNAIFKLIRTPYVNMMYADKLNVFSLVLNDTQIS